MEKRIVYNEIAPEKKFLWLHHKDGNLVLEGFGNNGWETVSNETKYEKSITEIKDCLNELKKEDKITNLPIKVKLPKLTENCLKKDLLATVNTLKEALVKAGIIEL